MTNTNNTKISFTQGAVCHVFETKGVRNGSKGMQTSERKGLDHPDIDPSEDLLVLQKLGSTQALCKRADGSEVVVHINHINPDSAYYGTRRKSGSPKIVKSTAKLTPAEELAQAMENAAKAAEALRIAKEKVDAMEAEVAVTAPEVTQAPEVVDTVSDELREQAAALFDDVEQETSDELNA